MREFHKIFILLITMVMLASPALAYTSVISMPEKEEAGCCAQKKMEYKSEESHHSNDCGDGHCKDNCPSHDCCVHTSMKNFVQQISQKLPVYFFAERQIKNEFYSSLYIKDISYSFWHPPKNIS